MPKIVDRSLDEVFRRLSRDLYPSYLRQEMTPDLFSSSPVRRSYEMGHSPAEYPGNYARSIAELWGYGGARAEYFERKMDHEDYFRPIPVFLNLPPVVHRQSRALNLTLLAASVLALGPR